MDELYVNHYITITGYINPATFMNKLYHEIKIDETFDAEKTFDSSEKEYKFEITFEKTPDSDNLEEEEEEEELGIEDKNCIIMIHLYQNEKNEYILAFNKEEGENEDYYNYFLKIKDIIKKI